MYRVLLLRVADCSRHFPPNAAGDYCDCRGGKTNVSLGRLVRNH